MKPVFASAFSVAVLSGQNKAVTVQRQIYLPPLTAKDIAVIDIAKSYGIRNFALSFANSAEDVETLRARVGRDARIISKIECRAGLRNLEEIAAASDALLIDRGDLSREIPIEQIPRIQKEIIRKTKGFGRRIYVATNLLESMVSQRSPTRAEVNDIYNTLADGADGLVLAAETAIGEYPVRCAAMIVRMVHEHQNQPDLVDLVSRRLVQQFDHATRRYAGATACRCRRQSKRDRPSPATGQHFRRHGLRAIGPWNLLAVVYGSRDASLRA